MVLPDVRSSGLQSMTQLLTIINISSVSAAQSLGSWIVCPPTGGVMKVAITPEAVRA